ncbi:MAG: phosphoribosylglycinamide formyltransferase, partial [Prevotella sp.]|nr:phosphoribosylglycinamide formyltransferase [Prevotella sp.]
QIIAQYTTPLKPEDTPDDIAAKEHILEMKYFPEVIEKVISKLS